MPIGKMNLSPRNMGMLNNMIKNPHGILGLVVGRLGSGKTTDPTCRTWLPKIQPDKKIWTAEDPVGDYAAAGYQTSAMCAEIGFTFAMR